MWAKVAPDCLPFKWIKRKDTSKNKSRIIRDLHELDVCVIYIYKLNLLLNHFALLRLAFLYFSFLSQCRWSLYFFALYKSLRGWRRNFASRRCFGCINSGAVLSVCRLLVNRLRSRVTPARPPARLAARLSTHSLTDSLTQLSRE